MDTGIAASASMALGGIGALVLFSSLASRAGERMERHERKGVTSAGRRDTFVTLEEL